MASNSGTSAELSDVTFSTASYYAQDGYDYDCDQDTVIFDNQENEGHYDDSFMASSQIQQNQQLYYNLDNALVNLPRDLYVEKLINETRGDCDLILWYRRILNDRARLLDNCPKGELKGRKSTIKSTNIQKLAADCCKLSAFIHGDSSEIDSVFTPSTSKKQNHSASESNVHKSATFQTELIVMKSTIHTAMTRITSLESNLQTFQKLAEKCDKHVKTLIEQNKSLEESVQTLDYQKSELQERYDNLQKELIEKSKLITQNRQSTETVQKRLEKLTSEQNAKFTTYDAFKKRISTPLKNLETFDSATTENKIKSLEQAEKSPCHPKFNSQKANDVFKIVCKQCLPAKRYECCKFYRRCEYKRNITKSA